MIETKVTQSLDDGLEGSVSTASALKAVSNYRQNFSLRVKTAVFMVFAVICKEDLKQTLFRTAFMMCLDAFQLVGFAFQPKLPWPEALRPAQAAFGVFHYTDLLTSAWAQHQTLWLVVMASVTLTFCCLSLVAWQVYSKKVTWIRPLRFLRLAVGFYMSFLYIPVIKVLLRTLDCDYFGDYTVHRQFEDIECFAGSHLALSIVSIVFSVLLSALLFATSLVYHDSKPDLDTVTARTHGRFEAMYISSKLLLSAGTTFLTATPHTWALELLLVGLSFSLAFFWFKYLPFYHMLLNQLRCGFLFVFAFSSLIELISYAYMSSHPPNELVGFWATFLIPSFMLGFYCANRRFRRAVLTVEAGKVNNVYQVDLALRPCLISSLQHSKKKAILIPRKQRDKLMQTPTFSPNSNAMTPSGQTDAFAKYGEDSWTNVTGPERASFTIHSVESLATTAQRHPDQMTSFSLSESRMSEFPNRQSAMGATLQDDGGVGGGSSAITHTAASSELFVRAKYLWAQFKRWCRPELDLWECVDQMYGKNVLQYCFETFPETSHLYILDVLWSEHVVKSPDVVQSSLDRAKKQCKALDVQFAMFKKQSELQRMMRGTADLISDIELQRDYKEARRAHLRATKAVISFWSTLAEKRVFFHIIEKSILDLEIKEQRATDAYTKLLEKSPNNPRVLRSYAKFLQDVKNDSHGASAALERADELEDREARMRAKAMLRRASDDQMRAEAGVDPSTAEPAAPFYYQFDQQGQLIQYATQFYGGYADGGYLPYEFSPAAEGLQSHDQSEATQPGIAIAGNAGRAVGGGLGVGADGEGEGSTSSLQRQAGLEQPQNEKVASKTLVTGPLVVGSDSPLLPSANAPSRMSTLMSLERHDREFSLPSPTRLTHHQHLPPLPPVPPHSGSQILRNQSMPQQEAIQPFSKVDMLLNRNSPQLGVAAVGDGAVEQTSSEEESESESESEEGGEGQQEEGQTEDQAPLSVHFGEPTVLAEFASQKPRSAGDVMAVPEDQQSIGHSSSASHESSAKRKWEGLRRKMTERSEDGHDNQSQGVKNVARFTKIVAIVVCAIFVAFAILSYDRMQGYRTDLEIRINDGSIRTTHIYRIWYNVRAMSIFGASDPIKFPNAGRDFYKSEILDAVKIVTDQDDNLWSNIRNKPGKTRNWWEAPQIPTVTRSPSTASMLTNVTTTKLLTFQDATNMFLLKSVNVVLADESKTTDPNIMFVLDNAKAIVQAYKDSVNYIREDAVSSGDGMVVSTAILLGISFAIFVVLGYIILRRTVPKVEQEKEHVMRIILHTPVAVCKQFADLNLDMADNESDDEDTEQRQVISGGGVSPDDFTTKHARIQHWLKNLGPEDIVARELVIDKKAVHRYSLNLWFLIALIVLFLFSASFFMVSWFSVTQTTPYAAEIHTMLKRRGTIWGARVPAREIVLPTSTAAQKTAARAQIEGSCDTLYSFTLAVVYGDSALGVAGQNGRSTTLDIVNFGCPFDSCVVPGTNTTAQGVMAAVSLFIDAAKNLARSPMSELNFKNQYFQDVEAIFPFAIRILKHSLEMEFAEVEQIFKSYSNGLGILLASSLLSLVFIYFRVMRAMIRHISDELKRTKLCLLLIPYSVVEVVPAIREYVKEKLLNDDDS